MQPGVAVQVEKYSGKGTVLELAGTQFRYQDEAGQEYVVSASPDRVFAGMRYGQIEPLEVRIRGAFGGDRLEPGMLVAFHANMSGRRVVEPVERLTIVTPGVDRPLGIHDPEALGKDAIFGLFLGEPMPQAAKNDEEESGRPSSRAKTDRDAAAPKVVIGQVTKASGPDRFTISAGEKIDVGASLADGALLFVDSRSIADLAPADSVKLEGARIADGALFAVKVDVERPVPPGALERPKGDAATEPGADEKDPSGKPPAGATAGTPAAPKAPAAETPPKGKGASAAKLGPAVRGKVVEVN